MQKIITLGGYQVNVHFDTDLFNDTQLCPSTFDWPVELELTQEESAAINGYEAKFDGVKIPVTQAHLGTARAKLAIRTAIMDKAIASV